MLNSTVDYCGKDHLIQFEVLDFVHSLAVQDEMKGGVNGDISMGSQQINSNWKGIIQIGLQLDAHNRLLDSESATDLEWRVLPEWKLN